MNKFFLFLVTLVFTTTFVNAEILKDDIAENIMLKTVEPLVNSSYNYENLTKVPVKLRIVNEVYSEKDLYEGQEIKFRVARDVFDEKNFYIRKGAVVTAKAKVIITSGMNGIPASIILGDFRIDGLEKGQLTDTYEVFGQDRSLIVFPLKWALTILPPTGTLTNFIKGGHAKIKSNKLIKIYYYPNWV